MLLHEHIPREDLVQYCQIGRCRIAAGEVIVYVIFVFLLPEFVDHYLGV